MENRVVLRDGSASARREGQPDQGCRAGNPTAPDGAQVIDCGGRESHAGLIDAHWHSLFAGLPLANLLTGDIGFIHLAAGAEAERTLMRGFTTVRDLGGPVFAFKQAIDQGLISGPRIFPSGAMITSTGGHGDLRPLSDVPRSPGGPLSALEKTGASNIADSPDEVRLRVREQLFQGASQIKLVGGGGVSSPRSPLDIHAQRVRITRRSGSRPKTEIRMSRCMPTHPLPSSVRSPLAPGALNMRT